MIAGLGSCDVEARSMPQRITRREFSKRAVVAAAAGVSVGKTRAQESKKDDAPHTKLPVLDKLLAKPLADDQKKAASDALKYLDGLSEARWKHKLTEGSEPATLLRAHRPPKRKK